MNTRQAIHRYIEAYRDEHIEKLRAFLRQPAISAEGVGLRESAELLIPNLLCGRTRQVFVFQNAFLKITFVSVWGNFAIFGKLKV